MASQSICAKMTIQERLRKWAPTPGSICDEAAQVIDTITAENERLREALEKLLALGTGYGEASDLIRIIAGTALSQHTTEGK